MVKLFVWHLTEAMATGFLLLIVLGPILSPLILALVLNMSPPRPTK